MAKIKDIDIRAHLASLYRGRDDYFIKHEMDVGRARVDIAVFGKRIDGIEIKSEADNLTRLPRQIREYDKLFGKIELVTCENHLRASLKVVPHFWGVTVASGSPGCISLDRVRSAEYNPYRNTYAIANLLWKEECIRVLDMLGLAKGNRGKPRYKLWRVISNQVPLNTLEPLVIRILNERTDWLRWE